MHLFDLWINCSRYKFKDELCLFDHPLIGCDSSGECDSCKNWASTGLQWTQCALFYLCINCSGFKINENSCLFNHILAWSSSEIDCFKCKVEKNLFWNFLIYLNLNRNQYFPSVFNRKAIKLYFFESNNCLIT